MDDKSSISSPTPKPEQLSPQVKSTPGLKRKQLENIQDESVVKSSKLEVDNASAKLENTETPTQSPKRELQSNQNSPEIELNSSHVSQRVSPICTCTYQNQLECPHAYKLYTEYIFGSDSSDDNNTPIQGICFKSEITVYCCMSAWWGFHKRPPGGQSHCPWGKLE